MSIIISENGKNAKKIDKLDIVKEGYLQEYIHENPESIPVYEIEEDKKLLVLAREFRTESGPIDALAIDKDGDIYVVETKREKNPDKRTVVAQALDYGASLWRHSDYNEFISRINAEINNKFKISFEEKTKDFFGIDDQQIIIIFEAIKRNLQQGNIKFVILMDAVEDRLKDLIVYINQNSQFDIFAVQMEYYKFEKYEIMIPKLFGNEVKKDINVSSSNSPRKKWDEQSFFEDVNANLNNEPTKLQLMRKLYDFSIQTGDLRWGTGMNRGSYSVQFDKFSPIPLYVVLAYGKLEIHSVNYLKGKATAEQQVNLDKLEQKFLKASIGIMKDENFHLEINEWKEKVDTLIQSIKSI